MNPQTILLVLLLATTAQAAAGTGLPDPVTALTGATGVWDGSATGLQPTQGEGTIIGIVGNAIYAEHPAFAATGGDGYTHTNPLGTGVYLGVCASDPALCNDKLIGRWHFVAPASGSGYSSAAAAQAAGNLLFDISLATPFTDPPLTVDTVAGIAPHANLIEYVTCGDNSNCPVDALLAALDQAQADGVDALVLTVGGGGTSPWDDAVSTALRSLRAAGTSVSVSMVRSTASVPRNAPWTTSVQPSTHDLVRRLELRDFSGGLTAPTGVIHAVGSAGELTAGVVNAGDVGDALCHPGSLHSDSVAGLIVLCLRGEIALVDKVQAVFEGGGLGVIIANTATSSQTLPDLPYALPAALIDEADGNTLLDWLSGGNGHTLTMAGNLIADEDRADRIPAYQARGPNRYLEFLVPSLSAPAISVFAPLGPQATIGITDGAASAPVAGAMALLRSLHADWTPAEILSALMTTAVTDLRDDATNSPADPWLRGAGRIDIAAAARAGLVLHASDTSFAMADPAAGGDPATLNLASLVAFDCFDACAWTREIRAVKDGTWTIEAKVDGAAISVIPDTVVLTAGELLSIEVTADATQLPRNEYRFGQLRLKPTDQTTPDTVLTIALSAFTDADTDGVRDLDDNCLTVANPDQLDTDFDGFGNRCDPDLNNDGAVNFLDLSELRDLLGSANATADLNGDGVVNESDIDIMRDYFFGTPGPGPLQAP